MKTSTLSDIGLFREKNQDCSVVVTNKDGSILAIVADGVGGGMAGEVASKMVCDYFEKNFSKTDNLLFKKDINKYFKDAILEVNNLILDKARSVKKYYGMSTTITALFYSKDYICTINVGDSRTYGFINNEIMQLTDDDSYVNDLVKKGLITKEEAINHPKKNILLQAIGGSFSIKPSITEVGKMDYFLLCSDGLHGLLSEDEMKEIILNNSESLKRKCSELVSLALYKGGFDNITVVLCK